MVVRRVLHVSVRAHIHLITCLETDKPFSRLQTGFALSKHWKGYDIFKKQKDTAFRSSSKAVEELAKRFQDVTETPISSLSDVQKYALFTEMIQIALWGNATDLSLLSTISSGQLEDMQGLAANQNSQKNIVDNDTEELWDYLSTRSSLNGHTSRQIDIVLDNAGFEFFTDLVFASYLIYAKLIDRVVFHAKAFPWFVSDVTPKDIISTLSDLENPDCFTGQQTLKPLCNMIRGHFASGAFSVAPVSSFWTTFYPFEDLSESASSLYRALEQSELVIFKGDLNYRKLTSDKTWPYTTSFNESLGKLGSSRMSILALRTNKADVCVGLESEEQVARLEKEAPESEWVKNGKYAVVSFRSGRS